MCGHNTMHHPGSCGPQASSCCCGLEPTKEEKIEQLKGMQACLDKKRKRVDAALAELER